jgi:DNA-directed RNA polymerase II subunit RPB3
MSSPAKAPIANPTLSDISEDRDHLYSFTLSGVDMSLANSIRRTILSSIPTYVFPVEVAGKCQIEINTGRLHNEIMKHRLGCIPIHLKVPRKRRDELPAATAEDTDDFVANHILEVDVQNNTDAIMYVTTEHFRIKNTKTGQYIDTTAIFPKNPYTDSHVIFGRLRPRISDSIPGEHLKLTCEFDIGTAEDSSMYTAVSKAAYSNTIDKTKADSIWEDQASKLAAEGVPREEIEFQKRNFYLLDAQRCFVENSFDFVIQSIGVYESQEIVKMACAVLQGKFVDLITQIDSDDFTIATSESTIQNCFDLVLANEDYTIGKVLEYILYERFYKGDELLSFCGFKKLHPHDPDSIIRIAFRDPADKTVVRQTLRSACIEAQEFYTKMYSMW